MEKHTIIFNDQEIVFELTRKKVKNINLNIRPDMTIAVSANDKVPLEFLKGFVKEKAPWLLKNMNYFKDARPDNHNSKEYVSGESFKYLGKQVRLKVEESNEEYVKYQRGFLYLYVKNKEDVKRKKLLLDKWFRAKANRVFEDSLQKIYSKLEKYGLKKPKIMIRTMKTRWGSSVPDKNLILLNFELIKAPKFCIDYVVLHELIHFKFHNHDKDFFNFLAVLMPDWKTRKTILDEEVVRSL